MPRFKDSRQFHVISLLDDGSVSTRGGRATTNNLDSLALATMAESVCPICYGPLEFREVAPCYDSGHDPEELEHLSAGRHTYAELRIFGLTIVLCNFCWVDFSSY